METVHIYLAGGMAALSLQEQTQWRNKVRNAVLYGEYDMTKKPVFFSPPDYYNFEEQQHKSEKEVMEFDLHNLRKSDLVVVNFNDPYSIGTAMELMLAKEHHIPVIGLRKNNIELHPWIIECCTRICSDLRELVDHVVNYYLK